MDKRTLVRNSVLWSSFLLAVTLSSDVVAQPVKPAPRTWSALPPEIRDALQPGRFFYSHQIPSGPFGAQLPTMDDGIDADRVDWLLDQFSAAGLKWIRDGAVVGFDNFQKPDQMKNWQPPAFWIQFCKGAKARGINLVVTLRVIDGPGGKCTASPEGHRALAEWIKVIVPKLKPWVRDWEIDNEPNPEIPPAMYVQGVRAAYAAIKKIDPEARVHAGVLSMLECMTPAAKGGREPYPDKNSSYLDDLIAAGLTDCCDVVSIHPYRQPYVLENIPEHASEFRPWRTWKDYPEQILALKARLRKAKGRDVPIAITEVGFPTHFNRKTGRPEISETAAAKYLLRAHVMDHWLGIEPIIHFAFKRQVQGLFELEAHFSLVNPEWIRQPRYFAMSALCSLLDGRDKPLDLKARIVATEPGSEPIYQFAFQRRHDFDVVRYANPAPGRYEPKERVKERAEMVTLLFWRAAPAQEGDSAVPVRFDVPLPDAGYAHPILLDPMTMATVPYRELQFDAQGSAVTIHGLSLRDYPQAVRFYKWQSGERQ
jgi:hypothetical protein